LISKEINKAEHEYMNMCPPIIVLATTLLEKGRKVWRNDQNVAKKAWIFCSDAG
jgi:hypothetical protein